MIVSLLRFLLKPRVKMTIMPSSTIQPKKFPKIRSKLSLKYDKTKRIRIKLIMNRKQKLFVFLFQFIKFYVLGHFDQTLRYFLACLKQHGAEASSICFYYIF